MDDARELLREAREVISELRRQIHQWCDSNGGEADFDTSKAGPVVKNIDAFLATPTEQPSVVGEAEVIWLHRFINCVPFGEHAPASDLAKAHRIVEALDRTRFGGEGK